MSVDGDDGDDDNDDNDPTKWQRVGTRFGYQ